MNLKSIRAKTMLAILPLLILVMIILSLISYQYSYGIIQQQLDEKMSLQLQESLQSFETQLSTHKATGLTLARITEKGSSALSKEQYVSFISNALAGSSSQTFGMGVWYEPFRYKSDLLYFGPYVYKDKGQMVYTEDYMTPEYNFHSQDWYKIAANTSQSILWTDPYYDDATKVTMITAAIPFYDEAKKFKGVVTADMDLGALQKSVADIKVGQAGWAFLLDKNGTYLSSKYTEKIMKLKIAEDPDTSIAALGKQMLTQANGKGSYKSGGETYRVYYSQLPETGWILALSMPESELYAPLKALLWRQVAVALAAIALVTLVIIFYTRFIARNINEVQRLSVLMANGDLAHEINIQSEDEFGQMGTNFNHMITNLRQLLHKIMDNSQQVAASSEELTASAQQTAKATEHIAQNIQEVAAGTARQAYASNETTQAVSRISEEISHISQSMNTVTQSSEQTSRKAQDGNKVVSHALTQMELISGKVGSASQVVNTLGEKSKTIDEIISLITSIAGQTNLLALNAAIEAARAGEQGRGFAVVADEVRKLAEQSATAAREISTLIHEIQSETGKAVQIMNESTHSVKEGISMVSQAEASFRDILTAVAQVSDQTQEISGAIAHINQGTQKVAAAVQELADFSSRTSGNIQGVAAATEEQNASMEEIQAASAMLAQLAGELDTAINRFKL